MQAEWFVHAEAEQERNALWLPIAGQHAIAPKGIACMDKQELWSANYILLLMYNLCHSLGFYITMVVFTGYCTETYGLAPGVASLSVTVYVLAAIVARLLLGK